MSAKPWYRDARFLIPGLLVPLSIAFSPRLFELFGPGQADQLLVSISFTDPRRDDAGPQDRQDEVTLHSSDLSRLDFATLVADTVLARIGLPERSTNSGRSPLAVSVERGSDGILFVTGPGSDSVALHFGRFPELTDLTDVVAPPPSPVVQRALIQPPVFDVTVDVGVLGFLAGVYRVVLTAPAYQDRSLFLQLTNGGEVLTLGSDREPIPARFPIELALTPIESRPPIVAVPDCDEMSSVGEEIPYAGIGSQLRESLSGRLSDAGYRPVELEEGDRAAFDLNLSKGQEPQPGVVFADYAVRWSCQWIH